MRKVENLRKHIAASELVAVYLFYLCRSSLSVVGDSSPLVHSSEADIQQNTLGSHVFYVIQVHFLPFRYFFCVMEPTCTHLFICDTQGA